MSRAVFNVLNKPDRFQIPLGIILFFLFFQIPYASAAIQLVEGENDLGLISYKEAPKTWTVNLGDFEKVEVGTYSSGNAVPSRYGGWKAYLKINGEKIWANFGTHDITDYNMGKTVYEPDYRNQYYDLTSKFHKGQNTITYYHYTDGEHGIKVRVTKGTAATTAPTPLTTTTIPTTRATTTTAKSQCEPGNCGAIRVIRFNGAEVTGPLTAQQLEICNKVNSWLYRIEPVYGSRSVDRDITIDIVTAHDAAPFWRESENLLQVPVDSDDLDIAHELGHYTINGIAMVNNGSPEKVPLWFKEGIAEHIASLVTGTTIDTRQEYFTGNLVDAGTEDQIRASAKKTLLEAKKSKNYDDYEWDHYGASATFVEFLHNNYQKQAIIIVVVDSSNGNSIDTVLKEQTGKDFSVLEDEWLDYLGDNYSMYDYAMFNTPVPTARPLSDTAKESLDNIPVIGGAAGTIVSGFLRIFGI